MQVEGDLPEALPVLLPPFGQSIGISGWSTDSDLDLQKAPKRWKLSQVVIDG
jgi:hypothetical protein